MPDPPAYGLRQDIGTQNIRSCGKALPGRLSRHAGSLADIQPGGAVDGAGTLTSAAGGTLVRYDWDVRTTRRWMNLLAPAARPVFRWNHDELMRAGGEGLARRLGVAPVLPGTPAQRHRPDRNARWVVTAAVLTTVAVLGWRRHASSR
jgi:hypothetical protein